MCFASPFPYRLLLMKCINIVYELPALFFDFQQVNLYVFCFFLKVLSLRKIFFLHSFTMCGEISENKSLGFSKLREYSCTWSCSNFNHTLYLTFNFYHTLRIEKKIVCAYFYSIIICTFVSMKRNPRPRYL